MLVTRQLATMIEKRIQANQIATHRFIGIVDTTSIPYRGSIKWMREKKNGFRLTKQNKQ